MPQLPLCCMTFEMERHFLFDQRGASRAVPFTVAPPVSLLMGPRFRAGQREPSRSDGNG